MPVTDSHNPSYRNTHRLRVDVCLLGCCGHPCRLYMTSLICQPLMSRTPQLLPMIFSDFSFATSLGPILSQLAITSSVCCPSFGAGFNSGGLPSKRTGQVSHFQSPSGCFIVCMMPRSTN